jgi:hypothetical protein
MSWVRETSTTDCRLHSDAERGDDAVSIGGHDQRNAAGLVRFNALRLRIAAGRARRQA